MKPLFQALMILLFLFTACTQGGTEANSRNAANAAEQAETSQAAQPEGQQDPAADTDSGTPAIFMPERNYQFENVVAGQTVSHDFIVQNKGTAELRITRVRTG